MSLERKLVISPAWDRRSGDPQKNYGIHCVDMTWLVIGEEGAVQFRLYTGWYPHIIKKTTFDDWSDWRLMDINMRPTDAPIPADLGYHSKKPMYEGQSLIGDSCEYTGGQCYYDGSGLNAYKPFSILVHEGGDRLWEFLEGYYKTTFSKSEAVQA